MFKEFVKNLKFVWSFSSGERGRIILYFILTIFRVFVSIAYPFYSASLIVNITESKIEQFIFMLFVFLTIGIVDDFIIFFRRIIFERIFRKIYNNIQTELGSEILKLTNKALNETSSGVFIQRLTNDASSIATIFTSINGHLNAILSNIGIFVSYFVLSKSVFILVVVAFIIRTICESIRVNIYNKNNKKYKESRDKVTGFTGEIVRGAKDIKMLNGEVSFIDELKDKFSSLNMERFRMVEQDVSLSLFTDILTDITSFIVFLLVAYEVSIGNLSAAMAVVIINFGGRYNNLANSITSFYEVVKEFNLSATRVFDIFSGDKYEKESFGTHHLESVSGNFEFDNVSFKYDKKNVLKNMSFKVDANETVAFVGKSGAGKTTIFNILCKMYDNYDGKVTIDGVDLKELDKDSIRGNITIVSQNPYIFNMSIRDNLRLVKRDLTDREMKKACKMACLDDFIESLPDKYDTILGEGGVNLSGGQKQRLAIARAFVQKTEIILFDEATSALDNETQAKIQKAIDNLQKEYTILIIAHRLSTIKNADRIVFIDNGKVVAEGSHDSLLNSCDKYKELYESEIVKA